MYPIPPWRALKYQTGREILAEGPLKAASPASPRTRDGLCPRSERDDDGGEVREVYCNSLKDLSDGTAEPPATFPSFNKKHIDQYVQIFHLVHGLKRARASILQAFLGVQPHSVLQIRIIGSSVGIMLAAISHPYNSEWVEAAAVGFSEAPAC